MQAYLRPRWHAGLCFQECSPWIRCTGFQRRVLFVRSRHNDSDTDTWSLPIYGSDRISDKKSLFLAHASKLPDAASFPKFLKHLTSLSALKRATHCMYAYRTTDATKSQLVLGQNDGGESGSGDRLSRLLELSRSENVVIVVSRWYGGVKLGSDRWKRISDVAKQALERGGFVDRDEKVDTGTSKNTRKK